MRITSPRQSARTGFTLAELMIAVTIIIVLVALSATAILRFRQVGPFQATSTNLNKIKGHLDEQWKSVLNKANSDPINLTPAQLGVTSLVHPDARKNFVAKRLAQAFPISFVEIIQNPPPNMGAWPPYVRHLQSLGITTAAQASAVPADVQQGVCLMMILELGPQNAGVTADSLGTSATGKVALGNGQEALACLDAWGKPLLFSRNYKGTTNLLGIVSMGANARAGVTVDVNNAGNHTLNPTTPSDADDNVAIPD
jgi:Tfp pilus assembly protein PilE